MNTTIDDSVATAIVNLCTTTPSLLLRFFSSAEVVPTIANVCLAIPMKYQVYATQLRPTNQAFWQQVVLAMFDFKVEPSKSFNVEDCSGGSDLDEIEPLVTAAIDEWKQAHGIPVVLEEELSSDDYRQYLNTYGERLQPREYLEESLAWWQYLNVFFRPSQYGFLGQIQRAEMNIHDWPSDEDAFTLFCDLMTLINYYGRFDELRTFSDGDQFVFPCLLSVQQPTKRNEDHAVLEHCGIPPQFWQTSRPFPVLWAILDGKGVLPADDTVSPEDISALPRCYDYEDDGSTDSQLQALVARTTSKWCSIAVNEYETPGPAFYIGASKRSQRWLGFVGQRDY